MALGGTRRRQKPTSCCKQKTIRNANHASWRCHKHAVAQRIYICAGDYPITHAQDAPPTMTCPPACKGVRQHARLLGSAGRHPSTTAKSWQSSHGIVMPIDVHKHCASCCWWFANIGSNSSRFPLQRPFSNPSPCFWPPLTLANSTSSHSVTQGQVHLLQRCDKGEWQWQAELKGTP